MVNEFGLPLGSGLHYAGLEAPDVIEQILGKLISPETFIEITHRGTEWLVGDLGDAYFGQPYNPFRGRSYIYLVPKQFVDLTA